MRTWAVGMAVLTLSACGGGDEHRRTVTVQSNDRDGTTTTTTATTANGDARATVSTDDDNGKVKIDAPGFKLDVDVPKSLTDATDFDLDGVKLYPGSRMRGVEVKAGNGEPRVHLSFDAPADPVTVRGYMIGRFADKGRPVRADGMTLSGTTKEGKPFTIALSAGAGGRTRGVVTFVGSEKGGVWSGE